MILNARSSPENYDLALEKVNYLIEKNHFLDEAYFFRAKINLSKADYDQAEEDIKKAIKLNENNASYYSLLGTTKFYKSNMNLH